MLIYLDICCFNRPFDDQSQLKVRMESEAKLFIQQLIRQGTLKLAWSYMMDYENSANPFKERRINTSNWKKFSIKDSEETPYLITTARKYLALGCKNKDSLHLACAVEAGCEIFFTTDYNLLKKRNLVPEIAIMSPIEYISSHDD